MEKEFKRGKLFYSLAMILTVPILVLGIILVLLGRQSVSDGMALEIRKSLAGTARMAVDMYALAYPGEIRMEDDRFYMGDADMTADYALLDRIKLTSGSDISVFYGDTRVLTTVKDENGQRITGTMMEDAKVRETIDMGNEYYSSHLLIEGQDYYGYYVPLYNGKEVCGMVFAGMTTKSVDNNVQTIAARIVLVFVIMLVLAIGIAYAYAHSLIRRLDGIRDYIGGLVKNNFDARMPQVVYARNDEIAEMGNYSTAVAQAIKELIYKDPLTGLFNRRAARTELSKYMDRAEKNREKAVSVALGDIDFFKNVNDNYGHECGDMVLVMVSELQKKYMSEGGFCSRWGGEEFLIVYEGNQTQLLEIVSQLMDELRNLTFTYDEYHFSVTMTFGLTEYVNGETMDSIVKRADDLLYKGKAEGRNQIVYES